MTTGLLSGRASLTTLETLELKPAEGGLTLLRAAEGLVSPSILSRQSPHPLAAGAERCARFD